MAPLQAHLASSFHTVAVDWPGFGELPRPDIDWRPAIYEDFLSYRLTDVVPGPFAVIAAGHAAGYAVRHIAGDSQATQRLVLLSPTWRGPLPTMMGGDRPLFETITKAVGIPAIGHLLYKLNVNRFVIGMMARGHVYADPRWLTGERSREKHAVTHARGARHASIRFVSGRLDPCRSREQFLDASRRITVPALQLFAAQAPRKSCAEMQALAAQDNIQTVQLAQGKLSFYEEFPEHAAATIADFLGNARTA
jgi:pimeloyl-ACP methyl ester carboxylesterase